MATNYYLAVADKAPGEANWSILFPAFPGVTSVAERFADIMRQAKDALATAVEDIEAEDASLPPSIEEGSIPDFDRAGIHDPVALLVPAAPRQHNSKSFASFLQKRRSVFPSSNSASRNACQLSRSGAQISPPSTSPGT